MAGRASIVGAAATHVGKVREHNEDAHFFDADNGMFLVCDGMGGHAAGEVASAIAIQTIRSNWASSEIQRLADDWLESGAPESRKHLLAGLRDGALAAHDAILAEAEEDESKSGMGTTLVGAMIIGNEAVFAHAGDSRAYLVRDQIAMQLTEDHTLLARLLAAGIDVDVSGEGSRFRSMLTNALGIGKECKVSTFVVPLADGDRFLFCTDGITEYVPEAEIGEVLTKQPSPARAAQKLIDLALERGGHDNATAVVVKVLEAGEAPLPAEHRKRDEAVIARCPLWGETDPPQISPQQRLRAMRIAIGREHPIGERVPAVTLGDRVAWILVEGKLLQDGALLEPGAFVYPESLVRDSQAPDRDGLAVARTDVRLLGLRADDFHELCDDDPELGEALLERVAQLAAQRQQQRARRADTEIERRPIAAEVVAELPERPLERALETMYPGTRAVLEQLEAEEAAEQAELAAAAAAAVADDERTEFQAPLPEALAEPDEPSKRAGDEEHTELVVAEGTEELAPVAPAEEPADHGLGQGLDERFDAVFSEDTALARPSAAPRPASSERVPLILKPRTITPALGSAHSGTIERRPSEPRLERRPSEPRLERPPSEPPSAPAKPRTITPAQGATHSGTIEARPSVPKLPSLPPLARTASVVPAIPAIPAIPPIQPRTRPPSEPDIETEIELEPDDLDVPAPAPDEPELVMVSSVDSEDARITETVVDTSSQTLTVTVAEPTARPSGVELDDEQTTIHRPLSEPRASVAGSIPIEPEPARASTASGRAKRLSEGWGDE